MRLDECARDASARASEALESALRHAVIPRLVEARQRAVARNVLPARPTADEIDGLVAHALVDDPEAAADWIERARVRGLSFDSLCLDALAPAARRLGELWDDDRCDFAQVTLGTLRLTHALHVLCDRVPTSLGPGAPRALFVPVPGEQHGFGATMLVAIFRRSGWDAETDTPATSTELASSVRARHYDLAGISASRDDVVALVAECVTSVRSASCNRSIAIFVGGRAFVQCPALAAAVGADRTPADAREALRDANRHAGRHAAAAD